MIEIPDYIFPGSGDFIGREPKKSFNEYKRKHSDLSGAFCVDCSKRLTCDKGKCVIGCSNFIRESNEQ